MRQRGVTLVELLVTISVMAVAGVALIATTGYLSSKSGDALADAKAQYLADSNLANTLARAFPDVSGSTTTQGSFQISIAVSSSGALPGVAAGAAKRVDVTVTSSVSGRRVVATGYRLSYP